MGSNGAYAQNSTSGTGSNYAQNRATGTGMNNDTSANSGSSYRSGGSSSGVTASTRDESLVREVQQALNEKGFNPGPIDGKWGPRTQAALTKFQNSQGITASNKLDDRTLAALGVDASNIQTSQSGSASSSRNSGTSSSSRDTSTTGQASSSSDSSTRVSANSGGQMQPQKH